MDFAKQINQASAQIVLGDYDRAIVSNTNTLKTLKLVLSGDAKIHIPNEMYDDDDDDDDDDDNMGCSSSRPRSYEYDFYSSPSSSSFLKTAVAVKGRCRSRNSRSRTTHNNNQNNNATTDSTSCSNNDSNSNNACCSAQHQLEVSIFRDPIMVRGDHFYAHLDVQVCEQLSYVAIYNLALSHHLKSVQLSQELRQESMSSFGQKHKLSPSSSSSSSKREKLRRVLLRKALSLYEHSHQILMKQTINVGVPVIHSMALVSNLGQIHHALGDHHKAEMCMQYLLSTMMYVIDCGKVHTLGNSMDGFFSMILPLISQHEPAPAA